MASVPQFPATAYSTVQRPLFTEPATLMSTAANRDLGSIGWKPFGTAKNVSYYGTVRFHLVVQDNTVGQRVVKSTMPDVRTNYQKLVPDESVEGGMMERWNMGRLINCTNLLSLIL